MLKKFFDGLIFGSGFAVAFVIICAIGMYFVIPRMVTSFTKTKQPEFNNPREAKVAEPNPNITPEKKAFSFFKTPDDRMKIPSGGGILAMSPMTTTKGTKRPSTYQIWLTESKLWQIRTTEEKVEIEELSYPKNASVNDLDKLMSKNLGGGAQQSTMTVPAEEIDRLRSSGDSFRNDSLNGKLKITVDGVVFVLPNPY
jgi:hypothetical protein